jgi:RNA polymerase sigma-70 factor (ECF subfamily)
MIASQRTEVRARLNEYLPELYARGLRLTRSASGAQDVVQDTVERALRFEGQYEPGSNLRAWLHQILSSVFITHCRRRRRERSALEIMSNDPCSWALPETVAGASDLSPPTARALAALPPGFRQAVELVDIADLSYRDAAQVIGVPLGTVMSRLHRGRRMLAAALADARVHPLPEAA